MRVASIVSIAFLALLGVSALAGDRQTETAARGLVRAVQEATIAGELQARITQLPLREGEAFRRGDVLIDFDCDRPKAEWRVAEAERLGAAAAFENARRLAEYRAAGAHDVQIARAALEKAAAAVEVITVRLNQCRILAPFDGRVAELPVREHEMPQAGQPLMRIVSDSRLEVDMIVPARWLRWLRVGEPFDFAPEDVEGSIEGQIQRINAAIDPVSQTVKVVGALKAGTVLPGQGGMVRFRRSGS